MITQIIHKLLTANAAITAAVADHVFITERPQRFPLPAIVINRGSDVATLTLKGPTGHRSGFVRVTTLAATDTQAGDLMRLVEAINGYTGVVTIRGDQGQDIAVKVLRLTTDDGGATSIATDHRDGQGKALTHGIQQDFRFSIQPPSAE